MMAMTLSKNPVISADFVMVSWMHNTAIDINNIGREYNHRAHRGTQRIDLKTLRSLCPLWLNPVDFTACVGSIRPQQISADLLDSCHSFERGIRDKIGVFSLEFSIVPMVIK